MEKLASSALIEVLLDLTTTEVDDEVVGGVFKAGRERFDLLAQREIPCVFYGASSMERLRTEMAITQQIKAFKAVTF